jgi:hypothetical protein
VEVLAVWVADFVSVVLFLLPTGRPRFLASTIHDGGRPRRRPRPRARRSRLNIASSSCSRSWRNSSRIFETSICSSCLPFRNGTSPYVSVPCSEQSTLQERVLLRFLRDPGQHCKGFCSDFGTTSVNPYQNQVPVKQVPEPERHLKYGPSNKNRTVIPLKSRQFQQSTLWV